MSRLLAAWLQVIRFVDRAPGLRQLHWQPRHRRWYFPLRSAVMVSPSVRFLAREQLRRGGTRRYRLRQSGLQAWLRHPLNDMWIVDEIFVQRVYEPPAEVVERLERLGRAPRILDLGGHAGLFALFSLGRFPGAQVTSLEPNGENAAVLDASRTSNALQERWTLIRAAAGTADGRARMDGPSFLSRVVAEPDGGDVEVRDVLPLLDEFDLAKIDIEGGEWALFDDPRFREAGVTALVFEIHAASPQDRQFGERAVERLRAAGFRTGPLFDRRPDTDCVWAWRG